MILTGKAAQYAESCEAMKAAIGVESQELSEEEQADYVLFTQLYTTDKTMRALFRALIHTTSGCLMTGRLNEFVRIVRAFNASLLETRKEA